MIKIDKENIAIRGKEKDLAIDIAILVDTLSKEIGIKNVTSIFKTSLELYKKMNE